MLTSMWMCTQVHPHSLFILQSHGDAIFKVFYRFLFISLNPFVFFLPVKKTHWKGRNILVSGQMLTASTPDYPQVLWGHFAEAGNSARLIKPLHSLLLFQVYQACHSPLVRTKPVWAFPAVRWARIGCCVGGDSYAFSHTFKEVYQGEYPILP